MNHTTVPKHRSNARLSRWPAAAVLLAAAVIAQPSAASAQQRSSRGRDQQSAPLRLDAHRAAGVFRGVAFGHGTRTPQRPHSPASESWIQRHPVLLGALVGASTGLVIEHKNCGLSSCHGLLTGAFTGAGAWGGLIASALHKRRTGAPVGKAIKAGIVAGAVGAVLGVFVACYGAGGCGGVS